MAAPFRSAPAEGVRARLPRAVRPGSTCPRRGRCRGGGRGWGKLRPVSLSPDQGDGAGAEGRSVPAGRSPQAAAAPCVSRRLRQFTASLETSPTVITRQINGRIPDGRVAPIHGSSSPSQRSRQGEDKPRFQEPALQPTHHCHRARSCLGPKHRRLIKVYSRFSPIITLNLRARKHRAGSNLRGCSSASPAAVASAAPFHSLLVPPRKPASLPPKKTCQPRRRRREKRAPSPHPTVPTAAADPSRRARRRGNPRGPAPAPVKSGPSLGHMGWHRFIGLSGNSPVYTAEEGLNG